MNRPNLGQNAQKLRLLVAIASYGDKNLSYLSDVIGTYQKMPMDVHVVVVSGAPKKLGGAVEVISGLPSGNPWSLPFAHKQLFADRLNDYDLFIYSEDDIQVGEGSIRAFLRVTSELDPTEIAGFLRFELDASGIRSFPDFRGRFHWRPESVCKRGPHVIAEFTNEHAACYILTQDQLRRAIASGGYLREPCEGRYDMLCTAATDPYTNCGFRKVICISAIEDFLIHHLPNRYAGAMGLTFADFEAQVQTLLKISDGKHPVSTLREVESKMPHGEWSKKYDEKPRGDLVRMMPASPRRVLTVGCGLGLTEATFMKSGVQITALPLDSVCGASLAEKGMEVIYGALEDALNQLRSRQFDCVVITDLLHLMQHPCALLDRVPELLSESGVLLLSGPNFDYFPIRVRSGLGGAGYRKLRNFSVSGVNSFGLVQLEQWLLRAALKRETIAWQYPEVELPISGTFKARGFFRRTVVQTWSVLRRLALTLEDRLPTRFANAPGARFRPGRFFADAWIVQARRIDNREPAGKQGTDNKALAGMRAAVAGRVNRLLRFVKDLALRFQRYNIKVPMAVRGPLRALLVRLSKDQIGAEGIEDWSLPLIAGRNGIGETVAGPVDVATIPGVQKPPFIPEPKVAEGSPAARGFRCLLVTSSLDVGGMEEVVVFLARRLPLFGIHTAVLHASPNGTCDGVPTGRLGRMLRTHGIETLELDSAAGARWVEAWKPDVISAHDTPGWILDVATRLSIPYIDTLHGMHSLFNRDRGEEARRGARLARVVAVSELVRRQYLEINPSFPATRAVTIPNGVDDWRRLPADREQARQRWGIRDEYVFLSLARCCLQKNTYGLVAAFEDVAARHPEAHLVIAGRPDDAVYFTQVMRLRNALGCRDRIHLRDHATNPAELLSLADGFVLDSFFEGWSLASMEALHAGVPVVLSEVGGAREQVGADSSRGFMVPNPLGDPLRVNWETIREARYACQANRGALVEAMSTLIVDRAPRLAARQRLLAESSTRFHPDVCLASHARILAEAANRT